VPEQRLASRVQIPVMTDVSRDH